MTILIVTVLLTLLGSFACSVMEAVVLSLTPGQLAQLHQRHPAIAAMWGDFKEEINRPLGAILICNTLINMIGATLVAVQVEKHLGPIYLIPFSLGFALGILVLSEILPKTLGVVHAYRFSIIVAPVLKILTKLLSPVIAITSLIPRYITGSQSGRPLVVPEEIGALATLARASNVIRGHQEKIITRAARLGRLKIRDVMIPPDQIVYMRLDSTLVENLLIAHFNPHTRFPVKSGTKSAEITGYINFKELVFLARTNPNVTNVQGIVRPLAYVNADDTVARVLERFVAEHAHMALVQDGARKLVGLVTLEDLVEELVGEIEDEFDHLPSMVHSLPGGTWMLGGKLAPKDAFALTGITGDIPPQRTLSEWIITRLGHVPKASESFRIGDHEITVRRVRRGQVFEASIRRINEAISTQSQSSAVPPTGGTMS